MKLTNLSDVRRFAKTSQTKIIFVYRNRQGREIQIVPGKRALLDYLDTLADDTIMDAVMLDPQTISLGTLTQV